jgi:hypothetical protein
MWCNQLSRVLKTRGSTETYCRYYTELQLACSLGRKVVMTTRRVTSCNCLMRGTRKRILSGSWSHQKDCSSEERVLRKSCGKWHFVTGKVMRPRITVNKEDSVKIKYGHHQKPRLQSVKFVKLWYCWWVSGVYKANTAVRVIEPKMS